MFRMNKGCYPTGINPNGKFLSQEELRKLPNGTYVTSPLHHHRVYQHARRVEVRDGQCWLVTDPRYIYSLEDFFKYNLFYRRTV
ncbi:hypothetical protein [Pseudomonas phage IR-QUMS-PaBa1-GHS-2021]|nr:hypothetical protein [Pseudomonas phage IR-QUMS-PaBa1-GHS-2021]